MNDLHCTHCGRFARRSWRPEPVPDLLAAMRAPSERHQRAEATKRARRQQARREHLAAWLAAGVQSPKAERLVRG